MGGDVVGHRGDPGGKGTVEFKAVRDDCDPASLCVAWGDQSPEQQRGRYDQARTHAKQNHSTRTRPDYHREDAPSRGFTKYYGIPQYRRRRPKNIQCGDSLHRGKI